MHQQQQKITRWDFQTFENRNEKKSVIFSLNKVISIIFPDEYIYQEITQMKTKCTSMVLCFD